MQERKQIQIGILGAAWAIGLGLTASGCHTNPVEGTTRGVMTVGVTQATVRELAAAPKAKPVLLTGEMTEKCPAAGCWFMLHDKTGTVRVDTKSAGFVVSDVPLHTKITVAGTVTPGVQPTVQAAGIRF